MGLIFIVEVFVINRIGIKVIIVFSFLFFDDYLNGFD